MLRLTPFFVFFILCAGAAGACELALGKRVLIAGAELSTWPYPHSNCTDADLRAVFAVLKDQDGVVPVPRLQAAVGDGIRIRATGDVRVEALASLSRRSFAEATQATIEVQTPFQGALIPIGENQDLQLSCHPCQFLGDELLKVALYEGSAKKEINVQARFTRLVQAWRLRRNVPAFSQGLSEADFEKVQAAATLYAPYLSDISRIGYYKTNKPLRAGEVIRATDVSPINLVRAGSRVEVVFEGESIRLKSSALSRQNGGFGDHIEIWNQATGRKHRGQVIDHNRVVVEL